VILGEVSKSFIGVEEEIFTPTVTAFIVGDSANLEPDDVPGYIAEFAARAERDQRIAALLFLNLAEDFDKWRGRVQHAETLGADGGEGSAETAKLDRSAAVGAIQGGDFGDGRSDQG
jgi:hypothetical protein